MEGEESFKVGKKSTIGDKGGEVDYRTKSGTAWSHNFLNQKPWHPLSYPNQRRKWIAEQTHATRQRRDEEVAREYAQEQEFFRQTALITKKEKEKLRRVLYQTEQLDNQLTPRLRRNRLILDKSARPADNRVLELMKAVSFMYVKPPGYNAESAKAAETAAEKKLEEQDTNTQGPQDPSASTSKHEESEPPEEKKKRRVKDIYGRALPTEEEFDALKNAPRLETGLAARAKPFGIEIRNVKCLRCGKYGHQSGDRECPLKDAIMPNEENRLKRDDPLTAIQAQTEPSEPLKWELKQQPGMSPPRGGFKPDDPNQQIVAEDIFDEYGGFLGEAIIPELLTNISPIRPRKKSNKKKHKRSPPESPEIGDENKGHSSDDDKRKRIKKNKRKKQYKESSSSDASEYGRRWTKSNTRTHHHRNSREVLGSDEPHKSKRDLSKSHRHHHNRNSESSDSDEPDTSKNDRNNKHKHRHPSTSEASDSDEQYKSKCDLSNRHSHSHRHRRMKSSRTLHSDKARRIRDDDRSSTHKRYHRNPDDTSDPDETHRSKHSPSTRHKHRRKSPSKASDSEYRSKHDHWDSYYHRDRDHHRCSDRSD